MDVKLLAASGENPFAVGAGELLGQWLGEALRVGYSIVTTVIDLFNSLFKLVAVPFKFFNYLPPVVGASVLVILSSFVILFIIRLVK